MSRIRAAALGAATSRGGNGDHGGLPDTILWPSDANFIDITQAPYNADPTGVVDATAAIQSAVNAASGGNAGEGFSAGTVFLPEGTYKVSNTITPTGCGVRLLGAGKTKTTIRLANNSTGYSLGSKAVYTPGRNNAGQANSAFANYIQHLTIEIGAGNPAAVALQADIANSGAIEHVRLLAPNGGGRGISLVSSTGNAWGHHIEIDGFDRGIHGDTNMANCFSFEDMIIKNCGIAIYCVHKNLWFVDLTVQNCPTVVIGGTGSAVVGIVNGTLTGGSGGAAIDYTEVGFLYLRNIQATGWTRLIEIGAANHFVGKTAITEWCSQNYFVGETSTAWDENLAAPVSLNLPIEKPPEYHTNDFGKWANVQDFGATPGASDRTAQIQAAVDSGAEIVYFPYSITGYVINGTVIVRGACRKLDFMFSVVTGTGSISVGDGTAPDVTIENLNNAIAIIKNTTRTVYVHNGRSQGGPISTTASGKLFVSNIGPHGNVDIGPGVELWTRQLDRSASQNLVVNGGRLVCLYDNVEGNSPPLKPIRGTNGAVIEVIGATADARNDVHPISEGAYFQAVDSYLSCVLAGHYFDSGAGHGQWAYLVNDEFGANTYELFDDALFIAASPVGNFLRIAFPLYVSPHWPPP